MSTYFIRYAYRKPGQSSQTNASTTVKAETEATAIRIVEGKHPGCEIFIKETQKKN